MWSYHDSDSVFSLPNSDLLVHIALRDCRLPDVDFHLLTDVSFQVDRGTRAAVFLMLNP